MSSGEEARATVSRGQMLAWAGVVLGAVYLIYIGGGWWGIYSPYLRITTMVIAAVTLGTWAVVAWRNPAWRPRTVMWPAIVAVLASMTISTIFSRVPRVSLEYLGYTMVLVALYLLLVRLFGDEYFRRRLVVLGSMLFVVSAGLYIATVVSGWIEWWQLAGGLTVPPLRPGFGGLTYNNPSAALTMVTLLAIVPAATFGAMTPRGIGVLATLVVMIGLVALMSGSRAGWFALALTALIAPLAWLSGPGNRAELRTRGGAILARPAPRIVAGIAVVVLLGVAMVFAPAVLRRVTEGGEAYRLGYAAAALRMFTEAPVAGTGPGTWVIQRPAFTAPTEPDYYIPHAHDVYVQTLAELGVVGGLAGGVLLLKLGRLLRRAASREDDRRRWWAWATGVGLVYFALHQVLDLYANMPAFLFAAAIPIAYLDATTPEAGMRSSSLDVARGPLGRGRIVAGALLVVPAVAGLLLQEWPALRQDQAVQAATANDWAGAGAPSREAAALDPEIGSYALTAGLAAARAGDHQAAAAQFQRVAEQADLPEAWLNLAAEQVALGNDTDARDALERALRLGHQRNAVSMAAGDLALRIGARDLAVEAFALSIARTPSLAADPWWQMDAARAALYPELLEQAAALSPGIAWEIELMAGDLETATALAAGSTYLTMLVGAWAGDRAAVDNLMQECENHPLDLARLAWCARVANRLGDVDRAASFRGRAATISIGASPSAAELRVSPHGMAGDQLAGEPADLWATYTYRRPAPWDIFVPSLIHLRLE